MSDSLYNMLPLDPDADLAIKAEIAGNIMFWEAHPVWIKFYKPQFEQARDAATAMLINPSPKRAEVYTDEYLRARITIINELLTMGARFVDDYERQREQQEEARLDVSALHERADVGHFGPLR